MTKEETLLSIFKIKSACCLVEDVMVTFVALYLQGNFLWLLLIPLINGPTLSAKWCYKKLYSEDD